VAPDVLFLSETKHDSKWMEWLRWKLGMTNLVVKDSVGASRGLAIFWRKEVNLCVKSFSKYHIDTVIKEDNGVLWQFTGIYGESKSEEKDNTWELLRLLKTKFDLPFVVILMKFFLTMKKRDVFLEQRVVWRNFVKPWKIVNYITWVLWEMLLHGGIITIVQLVI
jgi:hypothetical protein